MGDDSTIRRRGFVKICAGAAAAVGANPRLLANQRSAARRYNRVKLVHTAGAPLAPESLRVGESYVFHYPYATTPCFLLDLGRPAVPDGPLETEDGVAYQWQGGVGPRRSLVAFSAICAHKMSHPARAVSFINYRHEEVSFLDKEERTRQRSSVIYCCSEKSVYDPARGARVLGGPAPQPLTAIVLETDPAGTELFATGTFGGEMYEKFFDKFAFRLALEHGTADIARLVEATTEVVTSDEYSSSLMMC